MGTAVLNARGRTGERPPRSCAALCSKSSPHTGVQHCTMSMIGESGPSPLVVVSNACLRLGTVTVPNPAVGTRSGVRAVELFSTNRTFYALHELFFVSLKCLTY